MDKNANDLPASWKKIALDSYKEGARDEEVIINLMERIKWFNYKYWKHFIANDKEFSDTIEEYKLYAMVWWTKQLRDNLFTNKFNNQGLKLFMMNTYNWQDGSNIKIEDIKKRASKNSKAKSRSELINTVTDFKN